jgi:hypothetical protein
MGAGPRTLALLDPKGHGGARTGVLTAEDISELLAAGVGDDEVARLVESQGLQRALTPAERDALSAEGAGPAALTAIDQAARPALPVAPGAPAPDGPAGGSQPAPGGPDRPSPQG